GGAGGIGQAICRRFASGGDTVVLHHTPAEADTARALVDSLLAGGAKSIALAADFTDAAQVRTLVPQVIDQLGRLDVLVHNAATWVREPFLEASEENW